MIIQAMVDIYVSLIKAGRRTADGVPETYRPSVVAKLEEEA